MKPKTQSGDKSGVQTEPRKPLLQPTCYTLQPTRYTQERRLHKCYTTTTNYYGCTGVPFLLLLLLLLLQLLRSVLQWTDARVGHGAFRFNSDQEAGQYRHAAAETRGRYGASSSKQEPKEE